MPTLTTWEQPVAEGYQGQVTTSQDWLSQPALTENPVANKPTPNQKALGKRKISKITPPSDSSSKRKKQQMTNQLSIAAFFQSRKQPPPSSPLVNTTASAMQQSTSKSIVPVTTAPESTSVQRKLCLKGKLSGVNQPSTCPTDSLALCGENDVSKNFAWNRQKKIQRTNHIATKESLRDVIVGCSSANPPSPTAPQTLSSSARRNKDNDLLPRILAPALIKKKSLTKHIEDLTTTTSSDQNQATSNDETIVMDVVVDKETDESKCVNKYKDVSVVCLDQDTSNDATSQASRLVLKETVVGQSDETCTDLVCRDRKEITNASVSHVAQIDIASEGDGMVICLDQSKIKEATKTLQTPTRSEQISDFPKKTEEHQNEEPNSAMERLPSVEETNDISKAVKGVEVELSAADCLEIPAERRVRLEKVQAMRMQYCTKVEELLARGRDGLEDENFVLSLPKELPALENNKPDFPDTAVPYLAALVEGSRLSLSALANTVASKLNEIFNSELFKVDLVAAKVKVMATRESFLDNPTIAKALSSLESKTTTSKTNVFEDENPDRMWRWEVISLDLLPTDKSTLVDVKKARAARRKVRSHFKALSKLLLGLNDTEKLLQNSATLPEKLEVAEAKVSQDENQVLKFEREQEKNRLAADARKKKHEEQVRKLEKQKRSTSEAREEQKKQKAAEREAMKRKKAEDKERQKVERDALKRKADAQKETERQEKEAKLKRQQSQLRSFFGRSTNTQPNPIVTLKAPAKPSGSVSLKAVPSIGFRSKIDSSAVAESKLLFRELSKKAIKSRMRRTQKVSVPVYVTAISDESFDAQPYLEQKVLCFPNKYKFLSFHEDCRPAYHGTWSKQSKVVTGRNPFAQDTTSLDYENDSEAEWEEGDDDLGEDIESNCLNDENEDGIDDEEGDPTAYNYEDGWMQRDDDFGSDVDEETKLLLQRKLQINDDQSIPHKDATFVVSVCAIAPTFGGVPLTNETNDSADDLEECLDRGEALKLLALHEGGWFGSCEYFLDAFPPATDEELLPEEPNVGDETTTLIQSRKNGSLELSCDNLRTFARFVHHNTLPSKDKLLDELRASHQSITSSRAQGARTLDAIASKKRQLDGCVRWEVMTEVLLELGLEDLATEGKIAPKSGEHEKDALFHPTLTAKISFTNDEAKIKDEGSSQTCLNRKNDDVSF